MAPLSGIGAQPYGLGVFFAIGLLGGAHCLGMCGPLVTTYANRMGKSTASDGGTAANGRGTAASGGGTASRQSARRLRWSDVRQHALFNLGRTASYAAVGALLGGLGALVFDAAAILAVGALVRGIVGILVGVFILVIGGRYLLGETGSSHDALPGTGAAFERITGVVFDRIDRLVDGPQIVVLGAVHALLPCPLLYPAYLYALARGSPVEGALALGALGLGTFPTLFAVGTLWQSISARTRVRLHRGLGALFLVLGLVALTHGLNLVGIDVPRIPLPVYRPLA